MMFFANKLTSSIATVTERLKTHSISRAMAFPGRMRPASRAIAAAVKRAPRANKMCQPVCSLVVSLSEDTIPLEYSGFVLIYKNYLLWRSL